MGKGPGQGEVTSRQPTGLGIPGSSGRMNSVPGVEELAFFHLLVVVMLFWKVFQVFMKRFGLSFQLLILK